MESKDLWVELKPDKPSYMVLRGTYGEKIHEAFRMTRQGARWRFWRLFNDIYVSAFSTILFVEKTFGTELRDHAIRISKERHALRHESAVTAFRPATCPESAGSPSKDKDAGSDAAAETHAGPGGDTAAPAAAVPGAPPRPDSGHSDSTTRRPDGTSPGVERAI